MREKPFNGYHISGFVNNDTVSSLSGMINYSQNYSRYESVGKYTTTPWGFSSDNYDIQYIAGTLTVEKRDLSLSSSVIVKTYDGSYMLDISHIDNLVFSGLVGNDSITFSSIDGSYSSINTGKTTVVITGVTLSGKNAGNYTFVSPIWLNAEILPDQLSTPIFDTLTVDKTNISSNWSEVENNNGYIIEYRDSISSDWISIGKVTENSLMFEGIAGVTYDVRVKAVGSGNYSDSNYSEIKSIRVPTSFDLSFGKGEQLPSAIIYGDVFSISTPSIVNTGTQSSGYFSIRFYASSDLSNLYTENNLLGSVHQTSIMAGDNAIATLHDINDTVKFIPYNSFYFGWKIVSDNDSNFTNNVGYSELSVAVQRKNITLSSATITKIYDGSTFLDINHISNPVFSGLIGDDLVTLAAVTGSYKDGNVGTTQVTIENAVISGTNANYYNFTASTITDAVITSASLQTPTLSIIRTDNNSCLLAIGNIENAIEYILQYATDSEFSEVNTEIYTSSGTKSIIGLSADTTYYFRVKTIANGNYSDSDFSEYQMTYTNFPIAHLSSESYIIQEGCSFFINAKGSTGKNLTYLWNITGIEGDEKDNYKEVDIDGITYGESFWISVREFGFISSETPYTIRLKVRNARGIESAPVSATITVVEVPPCITVDKHEFTDGQVLKLDLSAFYYSRNARQWTINWGDGSDPSVYDICASHLTSAHYYGDTPGDYHITLTLVDSNGNGGDITYYIGTHTINGTQSDSSENDPSGNNGTEQPIISDTEGNHQVITVATNDWYDAEKTSSSSSSNLCYVGSAANILYYTGWASGDMTDADLYTYSFDSENDVMNYFVDHFTNGSGNVYYAVDWFLTGNNSIPTSSGWAQNDVHGGGFYCDIDIDNVRKYYDYNDSDAPETILPEVAELLIDGYGIGISLGAYSSSPNGTLLNGHAVTLWGYTVDPTYETTAPEYFTSLKITDSDDDKYLGRNAPDHLMTVDIQWNTNYQKYQVLNYGSTNRIYWIEEFVAIAPKTEKLLRNATISIARTVTDPILAATLLLDQKSNSESLGDETLLRSAKIDSQTNVSSKELQYQPMAAIGLNPATVRTTALESLWEDDFDLLGESDASSYRRAILKTSLESEVFAQNDLDDLFTRNY